MTNPNYSIDEQNVNAILPEIKRFLVYDCEFAKCSYYAICQLATLIARNRCAKGDLKMNDEYAIVAGGKEKGNSLRVTLTRYITDNYQTVKRAVAEKFAYRLDEDFAGVKTFIDDISLVLDMK